MFQLWIRIIVWSRKLEMYCLMNQENWKCIILWIISAINNQRCLIKENWIYPIFLMYRIWIVFWIVLFIKFQSRKLYTFVLFWLLLEINVIHFSKHMIGVFVATNMGFCLSNRCMYLSVGKKKQSVDGCISPLRQLGTYLGLTWKRKFFLFNFSTKDAE